MVLSKLYWEPDQQAAPQEKEVDDITAAACVPPSLDAGDAPYLPS